MIRNQRQVEILRVVQAKGSSTIGELAAQLQVSGETIRRNIKALTENGTVLKVHGGIVLPDRIEEPPYQRRMQDNLDAKQQIAAKVAELVQDGDSLILDGGTSAICVAQALREHSRLTVVTNSAEIARTLATRHGNRVFMAGGELRADDAAAFGEAVLSFVRQFHVKYAVLSVSSISASGDLMYYQLCDAEFTRAARAQAGQVIAIADHSKLGKDAVVKACGPEGINILVTDQPPANAISQCFAAVNTAVLVARPAQ